jgi:acyl carrier protein
MNDTISLGIKKIIAENIRTDLQVEELGDNFQLIGNVLDSMAVNLLILELEEQFGFFFEDDDLQAEYFETISSLASLVKRKTSQQDIVSASNG